jgi:hypothetical protein
LHLHQAERDIGLARQRRRRNQGIDAGAIAMRATPERSSANSAGHRISSSATIRGSADAASQPPDRDRPHVAEAASLVVEVMQRWPQHIMARTDGRPSLMIEGRSYPEDHGPGAGCPPEHGLSTAPGINWSSAEGVLGDADRDHIDTMVLYPSFGLCAPSLDDPEFAAGFARLYNQWIADYCRPTGGRLRGVAASRGKWPSTSCARPRASGWWRP